LADRQSTASQLDLAKRIDGPDLDAEADDVLVLQDIGPRGGEPATSYRFPRSSRRSAPLATEIRFASPFQRSVSTSSWPAEQTTVRFRALVLGGVTVDSREVA
jgi:hypothetical protein